MYKLRPRQQVAVDKIINFVNGNSKKNGIFVYPTSFGKSLVVANVANKFPDKYFIVITAGKELLKQNYEKFISYGYEAALCSASLNSKEVSHITFSTIGTIVKHADFFKDKDVVILFDEAHIGSKKGSQLDKFVKKIKSVKLVGLTATPFTLSSGMSGTSLKMMNRDRDCIYNSVEDVVQIKEVVDANYWAKIDYDVRNVDTSALTLNTTGTDYTDESVKKFSIANDSVNTCIIEIQKLLDEGRKSILVSVPSIDEAHQIETKFKHCRALYSGIDDKVRDEVIDDFKSLKLKVVVQVRILTVGFDHPQLDAIICMTPSNSLTFWYQYLGRGVRIHPEKEDCKVVDLSGNYIKFGAIEEISIEDNDYTKGYAAFSGQKLLTGYPLSDVMPTKRSLKAALTRELAKKEAKRKNQEIEDSKTLEIYFGKYKGKTVAEVYKKDKGYLAWLAGNEEFNWYGQKGEKLKKEIFEILKLEYAPPITSTSILKPSEPLKTENLIESHRENLSLGNMKDLF